MRKFIEQVLFAGTLGAIAMMPFGLAFRAIGLRIGHYGPKFAELYLAAPGPWANFAQHIVLGWVSAAPLALVHLHRRSFSTTTLLGAIYGALYYVMVNSLALPIFFGDPLPWTLGVAVVLPSLCIHVVFGMAVALTVRSVQRKQRRRERHVGFQ